MAKSLLQDELSLRHGAFGGTDNQTDTIDHVHDTLNLTTEVLMARGVDDIQLEILVDDRRALGHNGNTTLLFNGIGIHCAFVVKANTSLLEKAIHKGCLSVIDVSNNGKISHLLGVTISQDLSRFEELISFKIKLIQNLTCCSRASA